MKTKPKKPTTKVTITFPIHLKDFRDYHEFNTVVEILEQLGIKGVKYEELNYCGKYEYNAIFYLKQTPEFKKLKKELNAEIRKIEYEEYEVTQEYFGA